MKVGSIVECVNNSGTYAPVKPLLKTHYVIRDILDGYMQRKGMIKGLLLVEIQNVPSPSGQEWSYAISRFREIEFPPSLTEEIQRCLTRELEPVKINQ